MADVETLRMGGDLTKDIDTLISREFLDALNPLEYQQAEDFHPVRMYERSASAGYDMRNYWEEAKLTATGLELTIEPSSGFGLGDKDVNRAYGLKELAEELFVPEGDDLDCAGISIKSHQKARKNLQKFIKSANKLGGADAKRLGMADEVIRTVIQQRSQADSEELTAHLTSIVEKFREASPWVIAHSDHGPSIAARLVGFRQLHTREGLPIIEPVVLTSHGAGNERSLLPVGYQLDKDSWLMFEKETQLDIED